MADIRFGVRSLDGQRQSDTYKVTTRFKAREIYVFARSLGDFLKVSLHPSGKWHMKYDQGGRVREAGSAATVAEWEPPSPLAPGLRRVFAVVIPPSVVSLPAQDSMPVNWHVMGGNALGVDFNVYVTGPSVVVSGWPGKRGMGARHIGHAALGDGSRVWVVSNDRDEEIPPFQVKLPAESVERLRREFRSGTAEVRTLVHGTDPQDGVRVFFEAAIQAGTADGAGKPD